MVKKLLNHTLSIVLLSLLASPALADDATRQFSNTNSVLLPATALVDDVRALPINPGARPPVNSSNWANEPLFEIYMGQSVDPNAEGQFNVMGRIRDLSIGFQQFQTNLLGDLRKFSFGYSLPIDELLRIPAFLSLGASYNLTQEVGLANSNYHSFDTGLLFRPAGFLSLALTARNLNTPVVRGKQIKRAYIAGLGIRPFSSEDFSVTVDAQYDEGDNVQEITTLFGASFTPVKGLKLRGRADVKGSFGFDLTFQLARLNLGYFHTFNSSRNYDSIHGIVSSNTFGSIFQGGGRFAYLDLTSGFQVDNAQGFSLVGSTSRPSFWNIIEQINKAKTLDNYEGLVVEIGSLNTGMGLVEELYQAIKSFKNTGKKVIFYIKDAGMKEIYLSTIADKVVMHPLGSIKVAGFGYVLPHYKKLLDKAGIEVEFIRIGKYKTAMEPFIYESPSKAEKEQLTSIQKELLRQFEERTSKSRKLSKTRLQKLLNKGLFTASEAKKNGLVDKIAYLDQLDEIASELVDSKAKKKIEIRSLQNVKIHDGDWENRDQIAVIYANGSIVEGSSGKDILFGNQFVGSQSLKSQIREARENDQVKALVLRINSPGGSALASDEIFRALERFKKLSKKPIVVSMGDVAASGGYWIAMASDKIIANPGSITGSIGIYAGKTNLKGLYKKLGVNHGVIKTNPNADSNSDHRPYTSQEKQIISDHLREYYRIFLERVSKNRNLDFKLVEQLAQGRVYTGQEAKKHGLVDVLGGLDKAIQVAKSLAKIEDKTIKILHLPEPDTLISRVQNLDTDIHMSMARLFPHQMSIMAFAPVLDLFK